MTFPLFARTDLPRSVYRYEVEQDEPTIWWILDESETSANDASLVAKNGGSLGGAGHGTYLGPPRFGAQGLVVGDPAASIEGISSLAGFGGDVATGVSIDNGDFDLFAQAPFAMEAWVFPGVSAGAAVGYVFQYGTGFALEVLHNPVSEQFTFNVQNTTPATFGVDDGGTSPPFVRYHLVCRFVSGQPMRMWVNGTQFTGDTPSGTFTTGLDFFVGTANSAATNWHGRVSHAAVYTGAAATAVDQAWVDRHHEAGTAPWNGDLPGERLHRVLDLAGWSSAEREIDAGVTTLQSASFE